MQSMNTAKLEQITAKLALPPFSQKHTLISITELLSSPADSLKLLKEVTDQIKPTALSDEAPPPRASNDSELALQISEFASCVLFSDNYTIDFYGFANQLYTPNSPQLIDLLAAILDDLPAAKEKAYISKFKGNFRIPPEITYENSIYYALQQLRAAQLKFQTAYDENQQVLQQQISVKIEQMATEKQQLITREDKLTALVKQLRLKQVPEEAISLSKRRRESVSAIQQLQEQINAQNEQRKALLQRAQAIVSSAKGTPASIIEASQAENHRLKAELLNLPQEITEKEQLRDLIMQDPSDEQILQMEQEMEQAKRDLARLRELHNINVNDDSNVQQQESQVTYLRQQLAKFKRKHTDLSERLEKVSAELLKIDNKMRQIMNNNFNVDQLDDLDEMPLVVFKDLIAKGKTLKPMISRFQEERNYLKRENAVLQRTVEILTSICQRYGTEITENNEQQLINTQNVHEARQLLAEIEHEIRDKRARLQPLQNELVEQRRYKGQLESALQQERQRVQQISASYQGGIYRLRMTLQKAENECQNIISSIMLCEKKAKLFQLEVERAESEKSFIGLKKEIMIAQNGVKTKVAELRQRQQAVKEGLSEAIQQKKMFTDLLLLLKAKKSHTQSLVGKGDDGGEQVVKIV